MMPMYPNTDTLEAMLEVEKLEGTVVDSADDLFTDWQTTS